MRVERVTSRGRTMDSVNSPPTADRRRPFQFSLATLFVVTTGLAVILSSAVWLGCPGLALGILGVGSWWSRLAVRCGWRRLAYYLAATALGALLASYFAVTGVLVWPAVPGAGGPAWAPDIEGAVFGSVLATVVAAGLLRRWIRRPGRPIPWRASLGFCYAIGLQLMWILEEVNDARECLRAIPPPDVARIVEWTIVLPLSLLPLFLVIVTVSLPLTWPIACIGVRALRRIDPALGDLSDEQRTILRAVAELPGPRVEPLTPSKVAAHLGYDLQVTRSHLLRLSRLRLVLWTPARGYYASHPYWLRRDLDRLALSESREST